MSVDEDQKTQSVLTEVFGFDGFRPGQREAVELVQSGRDGLVVMPTGAGKSLCYQLPALLRPGMTIVVSPLLALMKDQCDALRAKGVAVAAVNSTMTIEERRECEEAMAEGMFDLVYVAPERFRNRSFVAAARRAGVSLLVVDEAHCVSQWGHDFRPDYQRIATFRATVGDPQTIGFTATATKSVRADVGRVLGLRDPEVLVHGFERPNLSFEIVGCQDGADRKAKLRALLEARPGAATIVYCATRKQVEAVAGHLAESGIGAGFYHGGLATGARDRIQQSWMEGEFGVLVATNAFGMGVDRPDVRAVIHWNAPGSLEAYYQEAGRAGRDGAPAACSLLLGDGDFGIHEFFIENTLPLRHRVEALWVWLCDRRQDRFSIDVERSASKVGRIGDRLHPMGFRAALRILRDAGHIRVGRTRSKQTPITLEERVPAAQLRVDWRALALRRKRREDQLADMIGYSERSDCLQRHVVLHFGAEPAFGNRCGACSNCRGHLAHEVDDASTIEDSTRETCRTVLRAVAALEGRSGAQVVALVLVGSRRQMLLDEGLDHSQCYGALRGSLTYRQIMGLVASLESGRLIERRRRDRVLLTQLGVDAMMGRRPFPLSALRGAQAILRGDSEEEVPDVARAGDARDAS